MFPPKHKAHVNSPSGKIIVAVRAEKVISKAALAWALTNIVRPGDSVTLLAIFYNEKTVRRFWSFPKYNGDCRNDDNKKKLLDRKLQICDLCSEMVLQFHDQFEVVVRIKVVSSILWGAVAAEAKGSGASWVILDKNLKQERNQCMEKLQCNIVVMKGSHPKVLRLNLRYSDELQTPFLSPSSSPRLDTEKLQGHSIKHSTPVSSPEEPSTSYSTSLGDNSLSSSDRVTSLFLVYDQNPLFEGLDRGKCVPINNRSDCETSGERIINLSMAPKSKITSNHNNVFWIPQNHNFLEKNLRQSRDTDKIKPSTNRTEINTFPQFNQDKKTIVSKFHHTHDGDHIFSSSIREAVSLGRSSSVPPPLCSLCQQKAPAFGKPPRRFNYKELEEATDGFSDENFLAEGGFGVVHKGFLNDGLVIAVKQLKFAGSQGDSDFCREVRILSCAQHRNVVLLVGFCVEGRRRVIVYEYICNGSLEFHLHGNKGTNLDWHSRFKIAIGTARGLRYLHEDCRVGCIVHRDMRPNNILLTHDFEPMVSDFGLVRLHTEWDICDEERVIGTSGYLAPEYFGGGNITEKVDIYSFGLVLLELITGRKISNLQFYKGTHFLSENFCPLAALEPGHLLAYMHQILDPCFSDYQLHDLTHELHAMGRAASLCLQQDPEYRPTMSKVVRILEGGDTMMPLGLDLNSVGSRSGHMQGLITKPQLQSRTHSRKLSH